MMDKFKVKEKIMRGKLIRMASLRSMSIIHGSMVGFKYQAAKDGISYISYVRRIQDSGRVILSSYYILCTVYTFSNCWISSD